MRSAVDTLQVGILASELAAHYGEQGGYWNAEKHAMRAALAFQEYRLMVQGGAVRSGDARGEQPA